MKIIVLLVLCLVAFTTASKVSELLTSPEKHSKSAFLAALSEDTGVDLVARHEHHGHSARATCISPPAFRFCTMITYPIVGDYDPLIFDDALYNSSSTLNSSNSCDMALKNFLCSLVYPRCRNGEVLPTCTSMCIDFAVRCGSFYSSAWCLDDSSYLRNTEDCTELLISPPLTCTRPTGLTVCGPSVNYPTPVDPSQNYVISELIADSLMSVVRYYADIMVEEHGWSSATAQHCINTYQEYYCRYTYFECKDGNPYNVVPPCEYECAGLIAACPDFGASGWESRTCLSGFPNLTCTAVDGVVSWSWAWGDPHLTTLDGYEYEFNGAGEFWLMVSDDKSLQVQARFEPCGLGTCTTALAFCLGTNCANKYVISASSDTALSITTQAGEAVTLPVVVGSDGVRVDPQDANSIVIAMGGKLAYVKVSASSGSTLFFLSSLKPSLYGKVRGLLGVFSGIISDDLTAKNGTVLDILSSQETIFNDFGLTWRVSQPDSLFSYSGGKTYETINNQSYVPVFSDTTDFEFSADAETACEGKGLSGKFLTACKFDVTVTANTQFASASQNAQTQTNVLPSNIDSKLNEIVGNPTSKPTSKPSSSSTTGSTPGSSSTTENLPSTASSLQYGMLAAVAIVARLFM